LVKTVIQFVNINKLLSIVWPKINICS